MSTEHTTTMGGYRRPHDYQDAGEADAPVVPAGNGWRMCGMAADDGVVLWSWVREVSAPAQLAPSPKVDHVTVGCEALRVHRLPGGKPTVIVRTKVVHETTKQWRDKDGYRYWKGNGRGCLGYVNEYLMTEAEYLAAGGVL